MKILNLYTPEETQALAKKIGTELISGDCLVLVGELGAGKTTFTKGLAESLGITQMIKSPTYTLVREYRKGRLPLFHMDVYRLSDDLGDTGLEEYFYEEGVTVVEWGDLIPSTLPETYLEINMSYGQETADHRVFSFKPVGPKGEEMLGRLLKDVK